MKTNIKSSTLFTFAISGVMLLSGCQQNSAGSDTLVTSYEQIDFSAVPSTSAGNVGDVTLNSGDIYANITIKDFGTMTVKLFNDAAPVGVQNFIEQATSGYYDGKTMHRIIADFMIQGGSANGDGLSADGEPKFDVEYCIPMRHFYGALCYANAGGVNGNQFYIVNNRNADDCDVTAVESNKQYYLSYAEMFREYADAASSDDEREYYLSYAEYMETSANSLDKIIAAYGDLTDAMKEKYAEAGGTSFLDGGYTVFGQTVDGFDVLDSVSAVEVQENSSGEKSSPVETVTIESVKIYIKA